MASITLEQANRILDAIIKRGAEMDCRPMSAVVVEPGAVVAAAEVVDRLRRRRGGCLGRRGRGLGRDRSVGDRRDGGGGRGVSRAPGEQQAERRRGRHKASAAGGSDPDHA